MAELHDLTALEQAEAVRSGELSPVDLTEHYLTRIERLDSTLGAFITRTPDLARKQAAEAEREAAAARREDRPLPLLYGVPVPVKDLNHVAGVRCTMGSLALAEHVPTFDDHLVVKLREGGTILLGKTNTPEFGLSCYTENRLAPPARTPWDLERSAGGSSGGAAAAVAGGLAPVAHASDGGGSVRIPASVCGLYGIKPSRGRISSGPVLHDVAGLSTAGPLSRTVADGAALLDVLAGPMPGDPYAAPALPPGETFSAYARRAPGRLRIACLTQAPIEGLELHPDCRAAIETTVALLGELGHQVEDLPLPTVDDNARYAFTRVWSVLAANRPVPPGGEELLMPLTRYLRQRGARLTAVEFARSMYEFRSLGQLFADALMPRDGGYDVILSPTVAAPPAPVGSLRDDADPQAEFAAIGRFTPFAALYNATGQPAVNVPLYWNDEGLPIGVMFAARYGDEGTLISLSAQLEEARPWAGRKPAVW
ncbi:amidase [Streptomyces sp. MST-110588]|uniref:amidase n=1 Tax=Streptomyces sp. MST-110588 TaxID=2833628 RepID=UPI001F5DDBF2|nr:amidase [Streptomyces sp. MST-110588]UNO42933.1 amidase [Streptomyces sp. MST-110588]